MEACSSRATLERSALSTFTKNVVWNVSPTLPPGRTCSFLAQVTRKPTQPTEGRRLAPARSSSVSPFTLQSLRIDLSVRAATCRCSSVH